MGNTLDVLNSSPASTLRLWHGADARGSVRRPAKRPWLFEIEACPNCRLVREPLTGFDLDAMICPLPHEGGRFRPKVARFGGEQQFPLLSDPNTRASLYESSVAIDCLAAAYAR
jgi:hypothetical protein